MCVLHGCTLEDKCMVGIGAVVLDGAVVESGGMVAARALVTPGKRVKKGELWGGSPARKLRDLGPDDLMLIDRLPGRYAGLGVEYREQMTGGIPADIDRDA
jgi:gamma-carbonic anhydrase